MATKPTQSPRLDTSCATHNRENALELNSRSARVRATPAGAASDTLRA